MNIIRTDRLNIIPAPVEFIKLLVSHEYARAGDLLSVIVPRGWPNDDDARAGLSFHLKAIEKEQAELLWRIRLIVLRSNRTVIGSINLKGPPDAGGTVEIGWGVSPEYRRQRIASEAAEAVIDWVCSYGNVERIIATIPSDNLASMRMAERLGMKSTGEFRRHLPVWELSMNSACEQQRLREDGFES